MDGAVIGKTTSYESANYEVQPAVHFAMRTTFIEVKNLFFGEHAITVAPQDYGTTTDRNDSFQIALFY